jgi:3'-5' exonuclease
MLFPVKNLKNTLFIDIETVSEYKSYENLSPIFKKLWTRKATNLFKNLDIADEEALATSYSEKAGIYAEFSKIICISCGIITDDHQIRIKSFYGDNEIEILNNFSDLLSSYYPERDGYYLCGHNIKEFDIPVICRRMVKHGIFMPNMLDIANKKPWQVEHLVDTMDLWRFGDYKSYTSLELLTAMLDIPSPKNDIDGSQVGHVYWQENDINRIVKYCNNDVVTVIRVMLRFTSQQDIESYEVNFVD